MTTSWRPYREPLRSTLVRTGALALALGALLSWFWSGGLARWPVATVLALWPAFGGHWVEIWFLNWLRPRISDARPVQVASRISVWFVGGCLLSLGMVLTARALTGALPAFAADWLLGGFVFIAVELVAHLALQARGRSSFYNGRG